MMQKIDVLKTDITSLHVDAIVNAANKSLLGGGGVDGAIHRAAGPELLESCRKLNGCNTGDAKITPGFNLPAKHVIHAVGPVWNGGNSNEDNLLKSCYNRSLSLCLEYNLKSIAFPNISTGVYGFPKDRAAKIAIETVKAFLDKNNVPGKVIFAIFDDENLEIYNRILHSVTS